MRYCDVTVRLTDSPSHTVRKVGVSVAEIVVLRAIHGEGAVVEIEPKTSDRRSATEEFERLRGLYGKPDEGLMDAGNGDLLERLFPGSMHSKRLPSTLADIGLEHLVTKRGKADEAEGGEDGIANDGES